MFGVNLRASLILNDGWMTQTALGYMSRNPLHFCHSMAVHAWFVTASYSLRCLTEVTSVPWSTIRIPRMFLFPNSNAANVHVTTTRS